MSDIQGVVATFQEPNGKIAFSADCFCDGKISGFDKKRTQEIRAKDAIISKFTDYACGYYGMSQHLSDYTKRQIIDDLRNNGWVLTYHHIGYNEE